MTYISPSRIPSTSGGGRQNLMKACRRGRWTPSPLLPSLAGSTADTRMRRIGTGASPPALRLSPPPAAAAVAVASSDCCSACSAACLPAAYACTAAASAVLPQSAALCASPDTTAAAYSLSAGVALALASSRLQCCSSARCTWKQERRCHGQLHKPENKRQATCSGGWKHVLKFH